MSKSKTASRRSLVMSILSMLLCVAMLLGTTFAWFTDTATASVNKIQAGTLKIDLLQRGGEEASATGDYSSIKGMQAAIFDSAATANGSNKTLWEPGATHVAYLAVRNLGSLALKYNIIIDVTDNGLASALEYAIVPQAHMSDASGSNSCTATVSDWSAAKSAAGATVGSLPGGDQRFTAAQGGCLDEIAANGAATNETDYFALVIHMKEDAGNQYQGTNALIDITVTASQKEAEFDSFSNSYDANAKLPPVTERLTGSAASGGIRRSSAEGKVTVTSDGASSEGALTEEVNIEIKKAVTSGDSTASRTVADATVPAPAAIDVMDKLFVPENFDSAPEAGDNQTVKTDDVLVLTLDINTIEAKPASIKLDVKLNAVATRTISIEEPEKETQATTQTMSAGVSTLIQPVEVKMQLDKGLESVAVTHSHDGGAAVPMTAVASLSAVTNGTFFYDKSTGLLTLQTDKFSEFEITYVAPDVCRIDSMLYQTVAEALSAYVDGDTIVLIKNIDVPVVIDDPVVIDKSGCTIDDISLGRKTLTMKEEDGVITVTENGYVAIIGEKGYQTFDAAMAEVNADGTTVEVIADCSTSQNFNLSYTNFTLQIDEGCSLTHNAYNGLFNLQSAAKTVNLCGKGKLVLNGGIAIYEQNNGATAVLKDITITGSGTAVFSSSGSTNSFTDVNIGVKLIDGIYYSNKVYSGYFMEDVSDYLVDSNKGCTALATTDANGCKFFVDDLSETNATLKIEREGQDPLYTSKVISSISGPCKVTVLKDVLSAQTTITGSNVVFDLNGKTWTQNVPETAVSNKESNSYGILLTNCSNVTIKNGTFTATEQDNKHAIRVDANSVGVKLEGLTVNFKDIYYGNPVAFGGTGSDVTVNDCVFSSGTGVSVFSNLYNGCLTVNSGVFNKAECYMYLASDKVLIGSAANVFTVADSAPTSYTARLNSLYYTYAGGANDAVKMTTAGETLYLNENATAEFTLKKDETLNVVYGSGITWTGLKAADGYELVENTSEGVTNYTVQKIVNFKLTHSGVTTEYATLSEAVKAATSNVGDTIKLTRDFTTTTKVTIDKALTFDLNGFTYTYTGSESAIISHTSSKATTITDTSTGKTGKIYAPNGTALKKGTSSGAKGQLYIYYVTLEGKNYGFDCTIGTAIIYSGKFIGGSAGINKGWYCSSDYPIRISGGTYSFDVSTIIDGSKVRYENSSLTTVNNGNGTWTVKAAS